MAHSTEAIVTLIFIVLWHFYHVHCKIKLASFQCHSRKIAYLSSLEYSAWSARSPPEVQEAETMRRGRISLLWLLRFLAV
jgi:hypothetical protein